VSILVGHPDAEKPYPQSNVVSVVGQLECRMEYQGSETVRLKLAKIDAEWLERRMSLADKPAELRPDESTDRCVCERFEHAPGTIGRKTEVLPLDHDQTYAILCCECLFIHLNEYSCQLKAYTSMPEPNESFQEQVAALRRA
jgi:hypothetical protein